jgi:hypothetical protein
MGGNTNPGARARAERELRRDPARSDHLIAAIARCAPQRVGTWRHALEAAGAIPAIPWQQRARRPRPVPFRTRSGAAIRAGATLPEQVMGYGVAYSTAYAALAKARARAPSPDVTKNTIAVRTIGLSCCIASWSAGRWRHARACPARR